MTIWLAAFNVPHKSWLIDRKLYANEADSKAQTEKFARNLGFENTMSIRFHVPFARLAVLREINISSHPRPVAPDDNRPLLYIIGIERLALEASVCGFESHLHH